MTTAAVTEDPALAAYELLAPLYDSYTAAYDHDRWLDAIEQLALEHGLSGRRLLDVGCGTGKSFLPMLARGYEVVACDVSPAMIARAREKVPDGAAQLLVADMRRLPVLGEFDLVTCLDDAINYLLDEQDVEHAFQAISSNMRPGSLLAFDVNNLATYRGLFSSEAIVEAEGALFLWRGRTDAALDSGGEALALIESFAADGDLWRRSSSEHRQRHHPRAFVEGALRDAGLDVVGVYGQRSGVRIEPWADEQRHAKTLYLARAR